MTQVTGVQQKWVPPVKLGVVRASFFPQASGMHPFPADHVLKNGLKFSSCRKKGGAQHTSHPLPASTTGPRPTKSIERILLGIFSEIPARWPSGVITGN